jgi:hypothetical protein
MRAIDDSTQHRNALNGVRWVLIAVCAALIVFSGSMAGRLGFAALLLLAIIVGRYTGRRRAGVLEHEPENFSGTPPKSSESEIPRREAGQ